MSPIQHTPECIAERQLYETRIAEWKEKWPNACTNCGATGACNIYSTRLDEPPDVDCEPCPECTEKGLCARCLRPGLTSEERGDKSTGDGPCKYCGWDYNDARPEDLDGPCMCEENYLMKLDEIGAEDLTPLPTDEEIDWVKKQEEEN